MHDKQLVPSSFEESCSAADAELARYEFGPGITVSARSPWSQHGERTLQSELTARVGMAHAMPQLTLRFVVTFDQDGMVEEVTALLPDGTLVGRDPRRTAYFRSLLQVEVLTENALVEGMPLEVIGREMDQGEFCGTVNVVGVTRLTRAQMAVALASVGSDGGFFGLAPSTDPAASATHELDTTVVRTVVQPATPYENGLVDALESMGLALHSAGVPVDVVRLAWQTTMDAVGNQL